jgi:hypothetical protein
MINVLKAKDVKGVVVILTSDTEYGSYAVVERIGNTTLSKSDTLDYEDALTIYNEK